jgi:hypothetical protein
VLEHLGEVRISRPGAFAIQELVVEAHEGGKELDVQEGPDLRAGRYFMGGTASVPSHFFPFARIEDSRTARRPSLPRQGRYSWRAARRSAPTKLMYRTFDSKFLAQVAEPKVLVNAGEAAPQTAEI